KAPFNFATM
nr:Chain C, GLYCOPROTEIN GPC [Lymphocytic choriomeningitis virus (strain WE)]3TBY_F Chain F, GLYCOPROTEIN GPC [Lymphocytic choriomeningitis virus (strain WE)]3TBY_I Chain I, GLYCOPROTEIN GPC [Lymphocytic choriomeningitis virus (strain WE)]3TBY_L Chain L, GLYCOPROTEIN GPC [Lymphocytic choriomeningitis virus (strain WE)]5M02_P Chain P, LCMV-DERIVED GP33 ALTERED PEPTIDE LIGAND PF [Mammarenavirus choriomeningitidis]